MSKFGRLPVPVIPKEEPKTSNTGTNTLPVSNIGIVNLEQKKKPHNINIKNHNPNEPKIQPNTKYTDKQNYRKYKTKTEPNLLNKILVNEDDDIVNKIKEAFGIKGDIKNSNFSEPETAPAPSYTKVDETPVEPTIDPRDLLMDDLFEIPAETREELTFQSDPEYFFDTKATPKRMSRREKDLGDIFPEERPNLLMEKILTPKERTFLDRLSSDLTPPSRMYKTPEQRKKEKDFEDFYTNELSFDRLSTLSKEKAKITTRKSGRPEASFGPVRRVQDAINRTPEENIAHFKTRKSINKLQNNPQTSYRELMNKRNNDEYKLQNFMFP